MERDELELIILNAWNEDREKGEPFGAFLTRAAKAIRKAGYVKTVVEARDEGLTAGREEVVKCLFEHSTAQEVDWPPMLISFTMSMDFWQAKLDEWGINPTKEKGNGS